MKQLEGEKTDDLSAEVHVQERERSKSAPQTRQTPSNLTGRFVFFIQLHMQHRQPQDDSEGFGRPSPRVGSSLAFFLPGQNDL